jgi:signal peptidase I
METCGHLKLNLSAEVLKSGGTISLCAFGSSMLPTIWPGDLLSIEHKSAEETVPGDIVLVAQGSRFIIHRLVEKRESLRITRGDSMPQQDPPVGKSQVLGKVAAIHRRTEVVAPIPRRSLSNRVLAWMLCYSDCLRNTALRIHSFRQRNGQAGPDARAAKQSSAEFAR